MLTEVISLPSKGNLYPKDHPLSSGEVEIKYMTAREEDILTTQSYIQKGIVVEKLLENVIVSDEIDPLDLTVGDKEKVLLETRILGYGPEYKIKYNGKEHTIDLSELGESGKPDKFDNSPYIDFKLEQTGKNVTIRIPNGHIIKKMKEEIEALQNSNSPVGEVSLRLSYLIHSIDGNEDEGEIRQFSKDIPARDSLALRTFVDVIAPDVDLTVEIEGEEVEVPLGADFFYPSSGI